MPPKVTAINQFNMRVTGVTLVPLSMTRSPNSAMSPGVITMSMTPLYSKSFSAANVWECDVPTTAIDKAAKLFAGVRSQWDWNERGHGEAAARRVQRQFSTHDGSSFFELRREGWRSDISWVSADDEKTHGSLREVFEAFNLDETPFGELVPGGKLRMFGAFYVVRSSCKDHNWHCDFVPKTFPALLTLITLREDGIRFTQRNQPALSLAAEEWGVKVGED